MPSIGATDAPRATLAAHPSFRYRSVLRIAGIERIAEVGVSRAEETHVQRRTVVATPSRAGRRHHRRRRPLESWKTEIETTVRLLRI